MRGLYLPDLVHVLAADDLVLQRVLLVEMMFLEIFLKARTEISADLTLQVARHSLALELHHSEPVLAVLLTIVLKQFADATRFLSQ